MSLNFCQGRVASILHRFLKTMLFKLVSAIRSRLGDTVGIQHNYVFGMESQFSYFEIHVREQSERKPASFEAPALRRANDDGGKMPRIHIAQAPLRRIPFCVKERCK